MDRLRDDCAAWIWGLKPGSGTNMQWHECRGRGPITKNQVAALLKDFEIRSVVVHPTKRADLSRHGYKAAQFEDAFARFLPPEPNIRTLKRGGGEKIKKLSARGVPRGGGDNERRWLWGPTKRVRMTSGTQNALNRVRGF